MINPPWLDLHPSHLGAVQADPPRKIFMVYEMLAKFL